MNQKTLMFETSALIDIAKGILERKNQTTGEIAKLERSIRDGYLKVVYTHIQTDEIQNDDERKAVNELYRKLNAQLIPTEIGVFGVSKFGSFKLTNDVERQLFERLRTSGSKINWIRDLVQALTSVKIDVLVTNDAGVREAMRQIRNRIGEEMTCEVLSLNEFRRMSDV